MSGNGGFVAMGEGGGGGAKWSHMGCAGDEHNECECKAREAEAYSMVRARVLI